MCFFYALSKDAQSLQNRYQLKLDLEFGPPEAPGYYISGFEFPLRPVITADRPDRLQNFAWGLIPFWVKDAAAAAAIRARTLNARCESVFEKPSFRHAIRRQRCLVPAEGFYEWRLFAGKKYPYYIYLKDRTVFSFAGIWDVWTDRSSGEVVNSFSILTTEANPLLERIHNTQKRMPVILPAAAERNWLRPDLSDAAILALTRPLDPELMAAHTIGRLIVSRTADRNTGAVQDAFDYPELEAL